MQVPMSSASGIYILKQTPKHVLLFLGVHVPKVGIEYELVFEEERLVV